MTDKIVDDKAAAREQIKVDRKSFDAACIFAAATLVQLFVPSPLDYFLFPATAAAWFVHSGQNSWMIDYAHTKAIMWHQKVIDIINQRASPHAPTINDANNDANDANDDTDDTNTE
jgi:hypothetical protein